jgi:hypothetical protein
VLVGGGSVLPRVEGILHREAVELGVSRQILCGRGGGLLLMRGWHPRRCALACMALHHVAGRASHVGARHGTAAPRARRRQCPDLGLADRMLLASVQSGRCRETLGRHLCSPRAVAHRRLSSRRCGRLEKRGGWIWMWWCYCLSWVVLLPAWSWEELSSPSWCPPHGAVLPVLGHQAIHL